MLGLADRSQVFDLFDAVMAGEIAKAFKGARKARIQEVLETLAAEVTGND